MTGIKRSSKQILPMVIGSTLVLGLIWLNTFIHQNSFSDSYGDFSFLIEIIPAISLATLLNTLVMFRPAVWQSTYSTADCAQDAAWGAIAMMALLFCEIGGQGNVSFFSYSSVVLGSFTFPKRYIYDFWVIIWFPIQVDAILRAMRHEDFSRDAQQNGFTSLFVMTLEELLFFQAMPNIWQFDLLLLNTFTLAVAVWKYVPTEYAEKSILHVGLYAIIRTLCLPLQLKLPVEGDTICMLSSNWEALKVAVREIATHAAFFGTSDFLKVSADAHYWLADNRTPVLQLLYYGGWAAVIGLALVLVGFIWVLVKLVDFRNARVHKEWSVYATAAGMLSYRAVCGMLYGFGAPWPVTLPFLGRNSLLDLSVFALILWGAWENIQISRHQHLEDTFVPAETLLDAGDQLHCQVHNPDGTPCTTDYLFDEPVLVSGKEGELSCTADEYALPEKSFTVFTTTVDSRTIRFILEHEPDEWVLPDSSTNELQQQVRQRYSAYHAPVSMEGVHTDEYMEEPCDEDPETV